MLIKQFEKYLQKNLDENIEIKTNPNAPDIAGVYLHGAYISVALPPEEIFQEKVDHYVDATGHPYRNIEEAIRDISIKYKVYKENPEKLEAQKR